MIYNINNNSIMSQTRCGHTSMREWFGLEPNDRAIRSGQQTHLWFMRSPQYTQLIIVLRNPYDRLISAIKNSKIHEDNPREHGLVYLDGKGTDVGSAYEYTMGHSTPYLANMLSTSAMPRNLKHIDFYRLNEYIPVGGGTIITNTSGLTEYTDVMSNYYSNEVMHTEYTAYTTIKQNSTELTPAGWNQVKLDD